MTLSVAPHAPTGRTRRLQRLREGFEPRDRARTARAASTLLFAGGAVIGVASLVRTRSGPSLDPVLALSNAATQIVLAVLLRRYAARGARGRLSILWSLPAVAGTVAIALGAIGTGDSSAAPQFFFLLPVLYAASQLRGPAAYTVTAFAVAGVAATNLALAPSRDGLTTVAFVGGVLVALTVVLVNGGHRQDQLTEQLRRQAATDPLTGLVTRRVLDDAAHTALRSAAHREGTALILVDIDHFKAVNDTHGHPTGDAALIHVTRLLGDLCRAHDVLSRLGGDELALLMPGCTPGVARDRAELALMAVRENALLDRGTTVPLTISVGVAHAATNGSDLARLYASADAALYEAKRGGRDRVAATRTVGGVADGLGHVPLGTRSGPR